MSPPRHFREVIVGCYLLAASTIAQVNTTISLAPATVPVTQRPGCAAVIKTMWVLRVRGPLVRTTARKGRLIFQGAAAWSRNRDASAFWDGLVRGSLTSAVFEKDLGQYPLFAGESCSQSVSHGYWRVLSSNAPATSFTDPSSSYPTQRTGHAAMVDDFGRMWVVGGETFAWKTRWDQCVMFDGIHLIAVLLHFFQTHGRNLHSSYQRRSERRVERDSRPVRQRPQFQIWPLGSHSWSKGSSRNNSIRFPILTLNFN